MGLDTSHDVWHGSYSTFNTFRRAIAQASGIDLDSMIGFGGDTPWPEPPRPIDALLNHSDCDGEILAADCGPLADALEQLAPSVEFGEDDEFLRAQLTSMIAGLRAAAAAGENVEFH